MPIIRGVIRNYSRYPIDVVWENAQDLEHVNVLHGHTNKHFELFYAGKKTASARPYDVLAYRSVRSFFGLGVQTFGLREIITDYNFRQIEHTPLLGLTLALNSILRKTDDAERPTMLLDEVVIEGPFFIKLLKPAIFRALKRHTAVQCREDEGFRARRVELRQRGIDLPFRLFNASTYERLTAQFTESPAP